jgi:polar amino acid transport system substrate-binding protein
VKILNHLLALCVAILVSPGAAQAQRTLKVAYTPFNVPIVFAEGATAENYRKLDPKADLARGAFIDLMKAVAGDAGLSIEFVPLVAGDHGAALLKGDIDILTAGARTPELDAAAVFSGPTYTYAEGLVVKNGDARPYRTYEDLRGEVVGAQRGTPSAVALQKIGIFAALKLYESGAELEQAVGDGAIKAGFDSSIYGALAREQQDKSAGWHVVTSYKPSWIVRTAFGARKADEAILKKLDASLAKLKADGTAVEIFARLGVADALAK